MPCHHMPLLVRLRTFLVFGGVRRESGRSTKNVTSHRYAQSARQESGDVAARSDPSTYVGKETCDQDQRFGHLSKAFHDLVLVPFPFPNLGRYCQQDPNWPPAKEPHPQRLLGSSRLDVALHRRPRPSRARSPDNTSTIQETQTHRSEKQEASGDDVFHICFRLHLLK